MTVQLSFSDIQNFAEIIEENEFFNQYANDFLPNRYDSNYVLLHYSPTLPEFLVIEQIQKDFVSYENDQQKHLKFKWPEDTGVRVDLFNYLNQEQYKIGKEELLCALPHTIDIGKVNPSLKCDIISKDQFDDFLTLNYKDDLTVSEEFADFSKEVYHYQFEQPDTNFLLVTLDNQPVGSLLMHVSEHYIEIDHVLTDIDYRKQGIASQMIHFVMNEWNKNEKPVILVADAEDTPKKLYEKLGFEIITSQISVEKELSEVDFS